MEGVKGAARKGVCVWEDVEKRPGRCMGGDRLNRELGERGGEGACT